MYAGGRGSVADGIVFLIPAGQRQPPIPLVGYLPYMLLLGLALLETIIIQVRPGLCIQIVTAPQSGWGSKFAEKKVVKGGQSLSETKKIRVFSRVYLYLPTICCLLILRMSEAGVIFSLIVIIF